MSVFEHSRWRIFNPAQHPLVHDLGDLGFIDERIPGVSSLEDTLRYIIAVLYPNSIGTFADKAALEAYENPQPNDYAIVSDDGDGKAAGYVYTSIDGGSTWKKRYDVDWSMDAILAETVNKTQYMYYHKYGMSDRDDSGDVITGDLAGQHLYGGDLANQHLTLHANSGDVLGAHTGFIQFDDEVRPTEDAKFSLGTEDERFKAAWFSDEANVGTLLLEGGRITDSSGAIDFGDEDLSTDGEIAAGTFEAGGTLTIAAGGITDSGGSIDFDDENLLTTGDLSAAKVTASSQFVTGTLSLSGGSITDSTGAISFGDEDLTTMGDMTAANGVFGSVLAGDLLLENSAISVTEPDEDLTLSANGSGSIILESALTTGNITTTGDVAIDGSLAVDGLSLDGTTITATDANGGLTFVAQGSGIFSFNSDLLPDVDNAYDLGTGTYAWQDLFLKGAIGDGTSAIEMDDLLSLRSAAYRDAARTTPAEAGDTIFWDGSQWLASAPDTEINHPDISGLTDGDAGHTQFVMLAGRSGGQVIYGGTESGEDLTLASTSDATPGRILLADPLTPAGEATFASTWSGTDLGATDAHFRHVYTKGEFFGLRLENAASGSFTPSGQNIGRLVYSGGFIQVDDGSTFRQVVMDTGTQSIAGNKDFTGVLSAVSATVSLRISIAGLLSVQTLAVTTSASITDLSSSKSYVRLTGSTAATIHGIHYNEAGQRLILQNASSNPVTLKNESGSAGDAVYRILTSSGHDLILPVGGLIELVYDGTSSRWRVLGGAQGSGGGGGSLQWVEDADAPESLIEYGAQVYAFGAGLTQKLKTAITVPSSYVAGSPVKLKVPVYSSDTTGTLKMMLLTLRIRPGTDAIYSTTHLHASTNTAINLSGSTEDIPQTIEFDVTDGNGQIDSADLQAGDLLLITLLRDTDTSTEDAKVLPYLSEVSFQ